MSVARRRVSNRYYSHSIESDTIVGNLYTQGYSYSEIAEYFSKLTGHRVTKDMLLGRVRRLNEGLKKPRK